MKTIERIAEEVKAKHPDWDWDACFEEAILLAEAENRNADLDWMEDENY